MNLICSHSANSVGRIWKSCLFSTLLIEATKWPSQKCWQQITTCLCKGRPYLAIKVGCCDCTNGWIRGFKRPHGKKKMLSSYLGRTLKVTEFFMRGSADRFIWSRSEERSMDTPDIHPWSLSAVHSLSPTHGKINFDFKLLLHQMVCQSCSIMHGSTFTQRYCQEMIFRANMFLVFVR